MLNILPQISKASIYLLVFLLPLFWLPFSFEAFEFNKQYLLFFLSAIGLIAWLGKMVMAGEIKFRKTPLDIFVVSFLGIGILSAVFSADRSSSLFGFYGRFADGLIGLLSLGIFYFLVTNHVGEDKKSEIPSSRLIKIFLGSAGLVIPASLLAIFGVWQKMGFLPEVMRQKIFNPVAGSLEGLAVFLSVLTVFLVARTVLGERKKFSLEKLLGVFSLLILVLVDSKEAWFILVASLVAFVIFSLVKRIFKDGAEKLLVPIVVIVVAVLGLSVDLPLVKGLAKEQFLDRGVSWQVAFGGAAANVKTVFLGSGIGTFHYDFAKEKPASFNQSRFWQIRFDRAGSYFAEALGTLGFLGIVAYLALIGMFLFGSYFLIRNSQWLPSLAVFVAVLISQTVYYQNTVLAFVFWLFLALGVLSWERPISEKIFSLKKLPELNLIFNALLAVASILLLAGFYFGARFYLADRNFALAQVLAPGSAKTAALEKAVRLNPNISQYWTLLSKSYFQEAKFELEKPAEQADKPYLQSRIASAIDAGKEATARGPGQVAAFESLAAVYRDIRTLAPGSGEWAVKYFQDAVKLEPTNPVLRTELAKILDDPEKARAELEKAVELKPDYLDALLQKAILAEATGELAEAQRLMERLVTQFPANIEVLFQLGRIYFNAGRLDESIAQLEKVLILLPNHSNGLYTLGSVWQKKGDKAKARSYFEKVLELNPGSLEVQKKLDELE